MPSPPLSRRRLLQAAGATAVAAAGGPPSSAGTRPPRPSYRPARADIGVSAYPFDLGQVRLTAGRWLDNQNRTLNYLRFVDVDRLLYNFRANHRLSTNGAAANGGWDAPTFPFRTHMQGHFLTAWAQAYAVLGDTTCRDKANYMVAELAKCQANNGAAGFSAGYLSGFPESDFTALEARTLSNGNVPYYCIHKTLAGLLDVWRYIGNTQARDVLLALAGWVDTADRPAELQPDAGDAGHRVRRHERRAGRPLPADRRRPLADRRAAVRPRRRVQPAGRPTRTSSTACTPTRRCPSGSARPASTRPPAPPATATSPPTRGTSPSTRTRYAIGGNSQAEHFRPPNAIAGYLDQRHLRAVQHLQHAQADPGAVAARPEPGGLLRLLRAGAAQPPDRRAEPGRQPRPHHLLHPAASPAAAAASARRGAAAPGAPTTTRSGAARAPASRSTRS